MTDIVQSFAIIVLAIAIVLTNDRISRVRDNVTRILKSGWFPREDKK